LSSNFNAAGGVQPQRPSLWNPNNSRRQQQQQQQQHAGYGAVNAATTATTTATTTTMTGTVVPTRQTCSNSDDPFVEKSVPSREVANRVYSMISELSVDDALLVAENGDGFYHTSSNSDDKVNGTLKCDNDHDHLDDDDDDKGFEEEYGFDPGDALLNGEEQDEETARTEQEESSL
jgi:hypothetical protein